ncbi:MAG: YbjN domain-containing protein [Parachlamydiaceae bacterium]
MINMTPESLLQFMRKNQYESDIQGETQQVYTILKINQKEYPLFLRVFDEGHLLQLLVFLPSHLEANEQHLSDRKIPLHDGRESKNEEKKRVIADLARLLHLLNKELDVPGFGMDEIAGIVFYRLMLPTPKKKIDSDLLLAFLKTLEHVCQMFATPIEAVSSGQMTLDQILAKAKQVE